MNVLLFGSGAKEHALAWKLSKSSLLDVLFIIPGNVGTSRHGTNIDAGVSDFKKIKKIIVENDIKMVILSSCRQLPKNIIDSLMKDEILSKLVFLEGNSQINQLTDNESFAKKFMRQHLITSIKKKSFTKEFEAKGVEFLKELKAPYLFRIDKTSGEKAEIVINDFKKAKEKLYDLSKKKYIQISIEEVLTGQEIRVPVLSDGDGFKVLPEIYNYTSKNNLKHGKCDFGSISPIPFVDRKFYDKIYNQIIAPTMKGLKSEKIDLFGILIFRIINVNKEPFLVAYERELKETDALGLISRIKSDLLDLFDGVATKTLSEHDIEVDPRTAMVTMVYDKENVNGGYKRKIISGLNKVENGTVFFQDVVADGPIITTNGKCVLSVTTLAKDIETARSLTIENMEKITFDGIDYQKDIGEDLL